MARQGPARVRSLCRRHPPEREPDQHLCSKRELDPQDLAAKEGGLAAVSRRVIAGGLISASVTRGAHAQKIA